MDQIPLPPVADPPSSPYSLVETTPKKRKRGRPGPSLKRHVPKRLRTRTAPIPAPLFNPAGQDEDEIYMDAMDASGLDDTVDDGADSEVRDNLETGEGGSEEPETVRNARDQPEPHALMGAAQTKKDQEKQARAEEVLKKREGKKRAEETRKSAEDVVQADRVWKDITRRVDDDGYGFTSVHHFLTTVFTTKDQQMAATAGRYVSNHGPDLISMVAERSRPEAVRDILIDLLVPMLQREGDAIKTLFSRGWYTSVATLLAEFSMEELAVKVKEAAPLLWKMLEEVGIATAHQESPRRDPTLIFTTVAAMLAVLRSERATNFQVTIGLFLLASGAAKREIEVLAHAGISVSYAQVLRHVKILSDEGKKNIKQAILEGMVGIVWDNVNIPFRVGEQRITNKNHFDNGTTATVIPLYDPSTPNGRVPHGTLSLDMKPQRTSRLSITGFPLEHVLPLPQHVLELSDSCLWQLKQLAMDCIPDLQRFRADVGDAPTVLAIPVHKTEQHPLPAMLIDESSLDGALEVLQTILKEMGVDEPGFMTDHGLLFVDGDLLTESLVDKIESARRNCTDPEKGFQYMVLRFGLFHAKMAGCRLVINEHWGKPNSEWPGGLCWENTFLRRKPMSAGWKSKKSTPWAPAHDLLRISLRAHIKDGFRIYCGQDDVVQWAREASWEEFDQVARTGYKRLFSTRAADKLRDLPEAERDYTLENNVLYNRDTLYYIVLVFAIKHGDIGCVVNVLRVWGVMMRGVMPRYAEAIFETLARLDKYHPKLRVLFLHNWLVNLTGRADGFKEVDLLQEHQNFWAKVMYTAKGSNKSWEWLSMITVCIFTLRDAMRTVHKSFKIPELGISHTSPAGQGDVDELADEMARQKVQEYVPNRPSKPFTAPVRDLFHNGADYANHPKAFQSCRQDPRRARYANTSSSILTASVPIATSHNGQVPYEQESMLNEEANTDAPNDHHLDETAQVQHLPEYFADIVHDGVTVHDDMNERPTVEDLAVDEEEFYGIKGNIWARAVQMVEDMEELQHGDHMYENP